MPYRDVGRRRFGLGSSETLEVGVSSFELIVDDVLDSRMIESKSTDLRERDDVPVSSLVRLFPIPSVPAPASILLNLCRIDETDGRETGKCMRFVGVCAADADANDSASGDTTLIPVLFGDRGVATMGAGIVL